MARLVPELTVKFSSQRLAMYSYIVWHSKNIK